MAEQPDKVSHASLNGIYVKAQELDRGHNRFAAPSFAPPGGLVSDVQGRASDASSHASTHASDAQAHASDSTVNAADVETHASSFDAQTHASE